MHVKELLTLSYHSRGTLCGIEEEVASMMIYLQIFYFLALSVWAQDCFASQTYRYGTLEWEHARWRLNDVGSDDHPRFLDHLNTNLRQAIDEGNFLRAHRLAEHTINHICTGVPWGIRDSGPTPEELKRIIDAAVNIARTIKIFRSTRENLEDISKPEIFYDDVKQYFGNSLGAEAKSLSEQRNPSPHTLHFFSLVLRLYMETREQVRDISIDRTLTMNLIDKIFEGKDLLEPQKRALAIYKKKLAIEVSALKKKEENSTKDLPTLLKSLFPSTSSFKKLAVTTKKSTFLSNTHQQASDSAWNVIFQNKGWYEQEVQKEKQEAAEDSTTTTTTTTTSSLKLPKKIVTLTSKEKPDADRVREKMQEVSKEAAQEIEDFLIQKVNDQKFATSIREFNTAFQQKKIELSDAYAQDFHTMIESIVEPERVSDPFLKALKANDTEIPRLTEERLGQIDIDKVSVQAFLAKAISFKNKPFVLGEYRETPPQQETYIINYIYDVFNDVLFDFKQTKGDGWCYFHALGDEDPMSSVMAAFDSLGGEKLNQAKRVIAELLVTRLENVDSGEPGPSDMGQFQMYQTLLETVDGDDQHALKKFQEQKNTQRDAQYWNRLLALLDENVQVGDKPYSLFKMIVAIEIGKLTFNKKTLQLSWQDAPHNKNFAGFFALINNLNVLVFHTQKTMTINDREIPTLLDFNRNRQGLQGIDPFYLEDNFLSDFSDSKTRFIHQSKNHFSTLILPEELRGITK